MKIGIIIAELPGDDPTAIEVIGSPAPYRDALDTYGELIDDPEVQAKYSGLSVWTRHGIAKKRKLRGVAVPAAAPQEAEAEPAPEKKASKKAARKRTATKKTNE